MATRAKKTGQKKISVKPIVDVTGNTPVYYTNFALISHSAYEFSLSAARFPTKPSDEELAEAEATGHLREEALVQLIFPPRVIPGLVDALQRQLDAFEKVYGPVTRERSDG